MPPTRIQPRGTSAALNSRPAQRGMVRASEQRWSGRSGLHSGVDSDVVARERCELKRAILPSSVLRLGTVAYYGLPCCPLGRGTSASEICWSAGI